MKTDYAIVRVMDAEEELYYQLTELIIKFGFQDHSGKDDFLLNSEDRVCDMKSRSPFREAISSGRMGLIRAENGLTFRFSGMD